jgi:hypothetical protein
MTTLAADYRFSTHGMGEFVNARTPGQKIETYKGAYISITDRCNTDICTYCYARDQQADLKPMPIEDFRRALNWLGTISDFPEVYLVGGEPRPSEHRAVPRRSCGAELDGDAVHQRRVQRKAARHVRRPSGPRRVASTTKKPFQAYNNFRERWEANLELLGRTKECSVIFVINGEEFEYESRWRWRSNSA